MHGDEAAETGGMNLESGGPSQADADDRHLHAEGDAIDLMQRARKRKRGSRKKPETREGESQPAEATECEGEEEEREETGVLLDDEEIHYRTIPRSSVVP